MKFTAALLPTLILSELTRVKASDEEYEHHHNSVLCRSCGREVADPDFLRVSPLSPYFLERQNVSMFGASLKVPVEKLKNPAGVEFSVITFKTGGCKGVGDWTSDYTWYPGYSWRVCVCPQCGQHLGWMFQPEDDDFSEREKPSEAGFYAMIVSKIIDENFASTITMTTQLKNNGNYKEIYN